MPTTIPFLVARGALLAASDDPSGPDPMVDGEGTEAAAATSVIVGPTSAPPSLRFDRPFLFAIRERFSGTILFMGVIGDPRG